ncbi:MAG: Hsp20/alpha crystallin family protein [Anaerolineales bacterium]|nr:Hsp20/alpha crystallin family protein [Anaerolineales bacterium]
MEVQVREESPAEDVERTRARRCFVPKTDIYETDNEIIILADLPGANDKTVDVTLEKNVLSISALITPLNSAGYELAYAEYEQGDYQRNFRLSDEIDREKIEAVVRDGVLRLKLPKVKEAAVKKITVKTS